MTLDLLHNRIVRDTVTDAFCASVENNLCPMLEEIFGSSLIGIQMYEDFLADEFVKDKRWYYPMTAVLDTGIETVWVSWDISRKDAFRDGVPYSFLGEVLEFRIEEDVPIAFRNALEGRSRYFEGGYVKLNVVCNAPNITMLSGKYSQTFVDELNRQISFAICRAAGVTGIEDSTIEIDVVFTPETYMEHTSENVTYRRLLMTAKGCSPRDFWVKWTRQNSSVACGIKDNVSADEIIFEIGEDVPHKMREKEYRFLVYGKSEKYRAAMGRKNITEWRELIKRAVKRGELVKEEAVLELDDHVAEASDKLAEVLAKCGITLGTVDTTPTVDNGDFEKTNAALLAALAGVEEREEDYTPDEEDGLTLSLDESPEQLTLDAEEDTALDLPAEEIIEEEVADSHTDEGVIAEIEEAKRKLEEERRAMEEARRQLEEARARVEDEARARALAEEEARRLRREQDDLLRENQRLAEERRIAEEVREREEAARREQEEKLREQLELEAREKAREKLLFAEAARLAREEHERILAERNSMEEERRLEEERLDALRRAEEEKIREEEMIRSERERIDNEIRQRAEENARRRREIEEKAKEARARMENEARLGADARASGSSDYARSASPSEEVAPRVDNTEKNAVAEPTPSTPLTEVAEPVAAPTADPVREAPRSAPVYNYTSRIARLLFRRNIDPNVNAKIRELISAALNQFGKGHVYIKVRASIPDNTTVVLNFVKIPEEELDLLVDIIKYLGNSDLGIYKIIVE